MFSIKPIKQIKGLFSSYKNEQPVPADEYNANIRCMQQAIEHNGQLLEEHSEAFESLSKEKLPNNAVQTDLIADGAVTAKKLALDVQQYGLLSPEAISSYFKDFLLQHHRSKPDMQGSFMNGAIAAVNQTLTRQTTYTKTVEHIPNEYLRLERHDNSVYRTTYPFVNPATPNTYQVGGPELHTCITIQGVQWQITGFKYGWKTRYTFDQDYDVNTATDLCSITWTFLRYAGNGSISYETDAGSYCTVRLRDANDNILATLPQLIINENINYTDGSSGKQLGANITSLGSTVIKNVRTVEIESIYEVGFVASYDMGNFKKRMHPTLNVNIRFGTGTSERMLYEIVVPSVNSVNHAAIGAYVKATTTVDFDTYKFNMAPYCTGECPYQPAPGFESTVLAYVDETADSEYSAVLTDANAKRYYIRHDFQAPLIISARIKEDKPVDLHPDFIAGEYYSWPLHFIDNSYIAYANLNEVIQDLKEYFSDYLEDITYTEYSLGDAQLGLQFNTVTNNVTIESVSVAKYPGLAKPNLI